MGIKIYQLVNDCKECKICGLVAQQRDGLTKHIKSKHVKHGHIESLEDYFRKFFWDGRQTCKTCQGQVKFLSIYEGYQNYCSHRCAVDNEDVSRRRNENTKKSHLEKYGVENFSQTEGFGDKVRKTKKERYGDENWNNINKAKQTNKEKYDSEWFMGSKEFLKKKEEYTLENYGVRHLSQTQEFKEKYAQTCLERYGVDHTLKVPEIQQRITASQIEKYGGRWNASSEIREKSKETMINLYGADSPLRSSEIMERKNKTCLERYGHENPVQNREILRKILSTQSRKSFKMRQIKTTFGLVWVQSKHEEDFVRLQEKQGNIVENGPAIEYLFDGKKKVYHVDFAVVEKEGVRLVEVKKSHGWFLKEKESGKFLAKVRAAQLFSRERSCLPFKVWFGNR